MIDTNLTDTVFGFIDKASGLYGRMEGDRFGQDMQANCLELGMQSPIEHLFWIACVALCRSEYEEVNPEPIDQQTLARGIYITPQWSVGSYRVDFLIHQEGFAPAHTFTPVIVELDGHDFHDKDKRQRSYEKARDRDLVRAGYRVIHFTGSDVVKDPFACAYDALEMVGLFAGVRHGYDPRDPLGRGDA